MSEHSTKPTSVDDEIDLGVVFKAIQNFFRKIIITLLNVIRFYYKHKFILIALIVVGLVMGYFWEKSFEKTYTNNLLVTTNFESADYLYAKVESLNNKVEIGDSVFLYSVFGKNYKSVKSIEIKPFIDIYNFVSKRESNKDVFELLFEEEANLEFLENPINSKNYKFHNIVYKVEGENNHEKLSNTLITYFNNNSYFNEIREASQINLKKIIDDTRNSINQIDSILTYSRQQRSIKVEENELSFSDNTGLNDLVIAKRDLGRYLGILQNDMITETEAIKFVDGNYKVIDNEELLNKNKIKLFPLVLIILYSLIFLFRYISNKVKVLKL